MDDFRTKINDWKKIGFIGLGLIGGSIAKAIRLEYPKIKLIGHASRRSTLEKAEAEGVILNKDFLPLEEFATCDVLFLCSPVRVNCDYLDQLKPLLSKKTLITDVGSVKGDIHEKIRELGLSAQFIGGHPMAGSEAIGFENSSRLLLQNAFYILTHDPEMNAEELNLFSEFVHSLGAIPIQLTPDRHDFATASISHLPHIISASLVDLVRKEDTKDSILKTIAAGGFRDITRISSSSPVMWQNICLANRDEILKLLDLYEDSLDEFRKAILAGDSESLIRLFSNAKEYRDSLAITDRGILPVANEIYLFIEDKVGGIAAVSKLLADHDINIQNIGIIHNREFEDGVLRIETYRSDDRDRAVQLLKEAGYQIRKRK
ncbi:prephenate dehydrogenase/arogenate dehydrogenase family protein [Lachnospiraceae bacterium YH-ros2228]